MQAQSILHLHRADASKGLFDNHNAYLKLDTSGYFYTSSGSGLFRYDGISARNYRIPTNDNLVTSKVFIDAAGRKWFSTSTGIHTLEADSVRTWPIRQVEGYVSAFHLERDSFLWFTAGQQLFVINVFEEFSGIGAKYEGRGFVNYPWINKTGDIQGIVRPFFNITNGIEITRFLEDDCIGRDTVAREFGQAVKYLEIDNDGCFWLASLTGLVEFYPNTSKPATVHKHDPKLDSLYYTDVEPFGEQRLIVATKNHGLLVFNKETKCFEKRFTHYFESETMKPLAEIRTIYVDHFKNMWISDLRTGLWHTNLDNQKFQEMFPPSFSTEMGDFTVNEMTIVGRDSLIALVDHKDLYLLEMAQNQPKGIRKIRHTLPQDQKLDGFLQDQDGNWWVVTSRSLFILHPNLQEIIYSIHDPSILDVLEITKDTFAILTESNTYLVQKSNLPSRLSDLTPLAIEGNYLEQIHYDSTSNRLFVSFSGTSLQVYDLSGKEVKKVLTQDGIGVINGICSKLEANQLWIASSAGVFKYNLTLDQFENIRDEEGYLSQSFESIAKDNNGNIWLGSLSGLFRFDPQTGDAILFDRADGLYVKSYSVKGVLETKDDDLIFYGKNGATLIDLDAFKLNTICPKVVLENVLVENKPVAEQPFLSASDYPILNHDQNDLAFKFSVIEFSDPSNNRLNCILIRNSKDTLSKKLVNSNPIFPSLSPASYELHAFPINSDGVSFAKQKTVIYFKIKPPIYLSTAAFVFYALSLLLIILFVFIFIDRQRRKKHKEEKDRLKFSILESELKLRLLDHHMISNIFNSITNGIDRHRVDLAGWYSKQASRFYRRYLDINEEYAIDLKTEKEYIEEYIALKEKLYDYRFRGSFEIEPGIDPEETLIPTFLTQIFVENAIKHAFFADQKDGRLQVRISRREDQIVCEIEDNGIGRSASQKQKRAGGDRQSRGIQFTRERLAIIESQAKLPTNLEIIDLKDELENARGTLVRITYPFDFDIHSQL